MMSFTTVRQRARAWGFTTLVADQSVQDALTKASLQLRSVRAVAERDIAQQVETSHDEVNRLSAEHERLRLASENDVLRAPISGSVTGLAVQRAGQVAKEGATLLRIVPDSTTLIIDAVVTPTDRSPVWTGQPANVRFDAFDVQRFGAAHGWSRAYHPTRSSMI